MVALVDGDPSNPDMRPVLCIRSQEVVKLLISKGASLVGVSSPTLKALSAERDETATFLAPYEYRQRLEQVRRKAATAESFTRWQLSVLRLVVGYPELRHLLPLFLDGLPAEEEVRFVKVAMSFKRQKLEKSTRRPFPSSDIPAEHCFILHAVNTAASKLSRSFFVEAPRLPIFRSLEETRQSNRFFGGTMSKLSIYAFVTCLDWRSLISIVQESWSYMGVRILRYLPPSILSSRRWRLLRRRKLKKWSELE